MMEKMKATVVTNVRSIVLVSCILFIWIIAYFVNDQYYIPTTDSNGTIDGSTLFHSLYDHFIPIPQEITPETTVTFYAHGDVPYTRIQANKLKKQMIELSAYDGTNVINDNTNDNDVDFMIHVGDIRTAGEKHPCLASEYAKVASLLRLSPVPVFIILGDNDVHDCPNDPQLGLQLWRNEFSNFDTRYWNHTIPVIRPIEYPENFYFQYKHVLFIGVNIVGERTNDENIDDVTERLTDQVNWVMDIMREYQHECILQKKMIGRIVLFYHANPGPHTRPFFKPLRHFIGNDLNHTIPVLFMNGDAHKWMYQPRFYNESSLLRVTVTGLAVEPIIKVSIPMDGLYQDPTKAFIIDRRFESED